MPGFCPLCGKELVRGRGSVTDRGWFECSEGHKFYVCQAVRAVNTVFRYGWDRLGKPTFGVWGSKP